MNHEENKEYGEADVRPWERPGAVRRDCEPHRAGFLRFLACFGLLVGAFSLGLTPGNTFALGPANSLWEALKNAQITAPREWWSATLPVVALALVGLFVAIAVGVLTKRDLAKMRDWLMDIDGESKTTRAKTYGWCAAGLNAACLILWGFLTIVLLNRS